MGEPLITHGGHLGLEGQDIEKVNAHVGQGSGLLADGHEPEGLRIGLEPAARMGLKTDHAKGLARRARRLCGQRDDALMATVHAVEIAQRDGCALYGCCNAAPVCHQLHGDYSGLRGAMTRASPSITGLPPT